MKNFFKSVRRHIGRLDAGRLREQYNRVADEVDFFDAIVNVINEGLVVLNGDGEVNIADVNCIINLILF